MAGHTFYQLHLLLDKHYSEQSKLVDALAERIQSLGGISVSVPHDVAEMTRIERPPRGREEVPVQLSRLLEAHEMAMARMVQAGAIPVTWQQVMLEWQRDWARQDTYAAVNDIVRQHSGAYGMGINYARAMLGASGEGQATPATEGTAFGEQVKIPQPSQEGGGR